MERPSFIMTRRDAWFWALQAAAWSGYGAMLMAPWIGTYSVALMLPSKIAIAASGLVISSTLRAVYRAARERGRSQGFRKTRDDLPLEGLGHLPAALLGHADPGDPLSGLRRRPVVAPVHLRGCP